MESTPKQYGRVTLNGGQVRVTKIDFQARSIWLESGERLGFAKARRQGIDVEDLMAQRGIR